MIERNISGAARNNRKRKYQHVSEMNKDLSDALRVSKTFAAFLPAL
jgi:hypothetical protein